MTKLSEIIRFIRRRIDEATLDVDKYRIGGHEREPAHPGHNVTHSQGSTFADVAAQHKEKQPVEKRPTYVDLVPQPRAGHGSMSVQQAKNNGFRKITNFYVNPKHWGRGEQGDDKSVNWEGTDWIQPISKWSQQLAQAIRSKGIKRPTDVYKPEVWKLKLQPDFGPMD